MSRKLLLLLPEGVAVPGQDILKNKQDFCQGVPHQVLSGRHIHLKDALFGHR